MEHEDIAAIDVPAVLRGLAGLEGRTMETTLEEEDAAFADLGPYRDGSVYTGRFSGESPWERHPSGDEFVQVLDGHARLTILTDGGPRPLELTKGMVVVVPCGLWHRFEAPAGVSVLTITPAPTEHSAAADPREC